MPVSLGRLQVMDDHCRLEAVFDNPKGALGFIAAGGYVGVGNRKHIRYLARHPPRSNTGLHGLPFGEIRIEIAEGEQATPTTETAGLKKWLPLERASRSECSGSRGSSSESDPAQPWSEGNARPVY